MSEQTAGEKYSGTVLRERIVAGLALAEASYSPGTRVTAHAHAAPLVALVLDGAMTEERGRSAVLLESGALLYQPPDEAHSHRFHGTRCFILHFGEAWAARMAELGVLSPSVPLDSRRSRATWLVSQIREEAALSDQGSALAVEGLTLALVGELSRARTLTEKGARPGWLIRALDILHDHLDDEPSMAEIAAAVDVHPAHMARTFRSFYGCTMGEYVRRLRVERAKERLRDPGVPLSTVALEAGFADQAHFTRVFKKLTGSTPGTYRDQIARG